MKRKLQAWIARQISDFLTVEKAAEQTPLSDFERLSYEIRPADVILIEGRSRVSDVIKNITQSPWTHSALYIGRLSDIDDASVREHVSYLYDGDPNDQLIIEALLGEGTIVNALSKYAQDHVRICRPSGLSRRDAQQVIEFAVNHLGCDYDIRQLLDLARFLFPYGLLPRHWRSSLFEHNAGIPTRTVCSSMLAAAFNHVHFPVLPVVKREEDGAFRLYKRNARLHTPRDFDYSPYFEIIKYPYIGLEDRALYRNLPWEEEYISQDRHDKLIPLIDRPQPPPEPEVAEAVLNEVIDMEPAAPVNTTRNT